MTDATRRLQIATILFGVPIGGLTGICLSALILNWYSPGHEIYQIVRGILLGILGQ